MLKLISITLLIGSIILAGCNSTPSPITDLPNIESKYRPSGDKPVLPSLKPDSPFSDFLTYALLNNPKVEAAFYDWKTSVEEITVAGSLPQPKLTLGAELQRGVMAFLYGLTAEIPWLDKLAIQAEANSAIAQKKRYLFEEELLKTAFNLQQTYYEIVSLEFKIRFTKEILLLLETEAGVTRVRYQTGRIEIKDLMEIQIMSEDVRNEVVNLEDKRKPLLSRWRKALGIPPLDSDPPCPTVLFDQHSLPPDVDILKEILQRNVRLKAFAAEVKEAETMVKLAYQENYPDMMVGAKTDTKRDPFWWMPELSLTLPVWRKKIGAQIAAAQARQKQTKAMLSAEEIELAVLLAEKSFMWREFNRQVNLVNDQLLPRAQVKADTIRISYHTGTTNYAEYLASLREVLKLRISYITALSGRETAFAEISTMVLSHLPEQVINIMEVK